MLGKIRRYKRYSVSARALIDICHEESRRRLTTVVNTISQGGMGFYSSTPLKISTPVSVKLMILPNREWDILRSKLTNIEGKIASIHPQGFDYYIGISFNREIPFKNFSEIIG